LEAEGRSSCVCGNGGNQGAFNCAKSPSRLFIEMPVMPMPGCWNTQSQIAQSYQSLRRLAFWRVVGGFGKPTEQIEATDTTMPQNDHERGCG
jgi:hypothetical protein